MIRKNFIALFAFIITLIIIFYVTYFNQQRYYDIQEKNRISSFELLLNAKSEANHVCLTYASQEECYLKFVATLEKLNPRGGVELIENNKTVKSWDNERHKDDREPVSVSKEFKEFSKTPTVKLTKLTRHQNLYKSSLNAMFFSIFDYAEQFKARINGQPSTFGELNNYTFAKYVAWGRFYPILPIWIIALTILGYIISLIFKNRNLNSSINNLQKSIISKENTLEKMGLESELIKKNLDQLHNDTNEKMQSINAEKEILAQQIHSYESKLSSISNEKILLLQKINEIERLELKNSEDRNSLHKSLIEQKSLIEEFRQKNEILDKNNTKILLENSEFITEYKIANEKLKDLENLYALSQSKESDLAQQLDMLNSSMISLNESLKNSETSKENIENNLSSKENEIKEFLEYASSMESKYKDEIESKSVELSQLKSDLSDLQLNKENLQYELDNLAGNDTSSRKVFNVLITNPEIPKSSTFEYSEPEHHSKAYVKSIYQAFKNQKNYKIGNLITDLRGTKFNSKTPNTLKIVYNYAISPDINRTGYGLVAVEKDHGYAAYIHLTASNHTEAMLATKAIQTYCSVFKNYKIIP